jgi:phosphatidate cytidylyltransferase
VGGFYFFVLVATLSTLALLEFYALARRKGAFPQTAMGITLGILLSAGFMFARFRDLLLTWLQRAGVALPAPTMAQYILIVFLLWVPALLLLELFRGRGSPILNLSVTTLGALYISLFFGSLIGLRELFTPEDFPVYQHFSIVGPAVPDGAAALIDEWGGWTVAVVFAAIWTCDSAAFFAGRAVGRHKLFVRVSPNKTWEGALAGALGAVIAFVLGQRIALPYLSVPQAVICGSVVGVFGQLGDLAESLLKRDAGVKDSSHLIPGHGGILDRFDSLLFVSPLLFLYLDFVVF